MTEQSKAQGPASPGFVSFFNGIRVKCKGENEKELQADAYARLYEGMRCLSPPNVLLRPVTTSGTGQFVHRVAKDIELVTPVPLRSTREAETALRLAAKPGAMVTSPTMSNKMHVVVSGVWLCLPLQGLSRSATKWTVKTDAIERSSIEMRIDTTVCVSVRALGGTQTFSFDEHKSGEMYVRVCNTSDRPVQWSVAGPLSFVLQGGLRGLARPCDAVQTALGLLPAAPYEEDEDEA
jgi:hypothetical protein